MAAICGRVGVDHACEKPSKAALEAVVEPLEPLGVLPERRLLLVVVGRVLLRDDPLRGALEEGQVRDPVDERADDLHRGRAGADDADPRAVDRHVVVPAGAVEAGPGEVVETVDVGVAGVVQHAGRRDDDVGLVLGARRGLEVPAAVAATRSA